MFLHIVIAAFYACNTVVIIVVSSMCACIDLGLQIIHPDLGRPSQTNDRGKIVKASINSPIYRRGQCRQSSLAMGVGWTILHQHWPHGKSSSMSTFSSKSAGNNPLNDKCVYLTPFIFLCRLKINHTETTGEHAFILENCAVANHYVS